MYIKQYLEQHGNIKEEINALRELVKKNPIKEAAAMALHINKLAGKIKIHLLSEDKYLYPALQNDTDPNARKLAQKYQDEMGTLAAQYTDFKEKYNTQNKIHNNQQDFVSDLLFVLNLIEKRMVKEESELYRLAFN